ncbi:Magnesium-dependent phosphatase [Ceraceosorus bombacis]|uniref:Magnesium-dependent phosphatase n=1 Tax=Ceraceosorus bombacis TaxID=401625 RepID=A0A0P1BLG5_9BASI|nr:Magnesium-dependent phosphatase [Ceraceosorus bombacis]
MYDYSLEVRQSFDRLVAEGPMPKLFAFDLDYTLWPAWVDTHVDPPLRRASGDAINKVVDSNGQPLSFYPHVPTLLLSLARTSIPIAAASRTSAPTAAKQALSGLFLKDTDPAPADEPPHSPRRSVEDRTRIVKAISLFDYMEIYPGSKITHFNRIHKDSRVPYEDMIFFDDERRNSEVERKLGVHFVEISNSGLDLETFENGVRGWRAKRAAEQSGEEDLTDSPPRGQL